MQRKIMTKKFKRIYIELSDYCNLNCEFCSNKKNTRILTIDEYKHILKEIDNKTKEIVLHILGEPLIHKDIIKILDFTSKDYNVMITTNGFLLDKFYNVDFIKFSKMNISLHSSYFLDDEKFLNYIENVFKFIDFTHNINEEIIFNLRLWTKHNNRIENYIENKYQIKLNNNKQRLSKKVILTYDEEFTWPSLDNNFNTEDGICLGGKSHIGILANGEVTICCLDAKGDSRLGNVFETPLDEILGSERYNDVLMSYNKNKLYLDICKHCTYHNRKK